MPPGLANPLKAARARRFPLIVSKLDRLSRNVHFAAFGRDCDACTAGRKKRCQN